MARKRLRILWTILLWTFGTLFVLAAILFAAGVLFLIRKGPMTKELNAFYAEFALNSFWRKEGRNPATEADFAGLNFMWAKGPVMGDCFGFGGLSYVGKDVAGDWSFVADDGNNRRWDIDAAKGVPQYQDEGVRAKGDDILIRFSPDGWHRVLPERRRGAEGLLEAAGQIKPGMTREQVDLVLGPTPRDELRMAAEASSGDEHLFVRRRFNRRASVIVDIYFDRDAKVSRVWVSE